jgi:hypothetical protein
VRTRCARSMVNGRFNGAGRIIKMMSATGGWRT